MGEYSNYTIKQGDTLSAIAKRAGTTVEQLVKENGIKDPNKIQAGAILKLPKGAEISVFNVKQDLITKAVQEMEQKRPKPVLSQEEEKMIRDLIAKEKEKPLDFAPIKEWIKEHPLSKNFTEALLGAGGEKTAANVSPQEREAAKAEIDQKVSSTGISYQDANKTITEIEKQYSDDKYFTEWEENIDRNKIRDEGAIRILRDDFPSIVKHKDFNPNKLPEPAKTQYKEAVAAKREIEQNNSALVKKAGITPVKEKVDRIDFPKFGLGLAFDGLGKPEELTPKQIASREKIGEQVASNGIKYSDAKTIAEALHNKYMNDPSCSSYYPSHSPKTRDRTILPDERPIYDLAINLKSFDPFKMPEPDRTQYFEAINAMREIEHKNSALFEQTGYTTTPQPKRGYETPNEWCTVLY